MPAHHDHVQFDGYGAPEVLRTCRSPRPEPCPAEVRIRVEASSVQFTDTLIRRGIYPDLRDKPPLTPGYDVVGVVDAIGADVTGVTVGDRVADLCTTGGNAQFVLRPAAGLVPVPHAVDAGEAAALVLSWTTAHQALFRVGRLQAGETLLVVGGNGAVGRAAIELGVAAGATVFATASECHHPALDALGATPLPRDGWEGAVRGRVDVALDGVAARGFGAAYRTLAPGGRLVAIGVSALAGGPLWRVMAAMVGFGARSLLPDGRSATFYSITSYRRRHPAAFSDDLTALLDGLSRGTIRPRVAERLTLSEVGPAHRRLEAGGIQGKLVLDPWAPEVGSAA